MTFGGVMANAAFLLLIAPLVLLMAYFMLLAIGLMIMVNLALLGVWLMVIHGIFWLITHR